MEVESVQCVPEAERKESRNPTGFSSEDCGMFSFYSLACLLAQLMSIGIADALHRLFQLVVCCSEALLALVEREELKGPWVNQDQ